MKSPSLVLLGRPCTFTAATLEGLLDEGLAPIAVLLRAPSARSAGAAGPARAIHEAPADPVTAAAARCGIDVARVHDLNAPGSLARLAALAPEVILAACLDQRIGPRARALAKLAALNVHPSLLPAHRGPEPVFWQLRAGARHAGVSVHAMVAALDAGPVLAQSRLALSPGDRLATIEATLARSGGRLAAALLAGGEPAAGAPQDERAASAEPLPRERDLALDASWSARRAFVFMRALRLEHPLELGGSRLVLTEALGYAAEATLDVPFRALGDTLEVRLSPGVLRARGHRETMPGRSPPPAAG